MSSRVIAVVAVLTVFAPKMPEQCNKVMGKGTTPSASAEPPPPPPPPPPLSATTPPIWSPPPDTNPTPTTSTSSSAKPPAGDVETAQAKAALEKKNYKQVRTLLEKKLKTNTGSAEDYRMLREACEKLKDLKCIAAVNKASGNAENY